VGTSPHQSLDFTLQVAVVHLLELRMRDHQGRRRTAVRGELALDVRGSSGPKDVVTRREEIRI